MVLQNSNLIFCSGSTRAESIKNAEDHYKKIFPEIGRHFLDEDVTDMVSSLAPFFASSNSCQKISFQGRLMAIATPFCETYKPIVRADDSSCYWETPTSTSLTQECDAKEKGNNIIFWDSQFVPVPKETSVVTEFNLVTKNLM